MTERTVVSRDDVYETIQSLLATLEVDVTTTTPDAGFDALGLDSLDLVELSVGIEDAYGIQIEENDLEEVSTIGAVVDLVLKKLDNSD